MENSSIEIALRNIQNDIRSLDERLSGQLKEFKDDQKIRDLEANAKFTRIENRLDKIDDKFDRMDAKFDAKFDKMEAKFDKLTERVHRTEMKVYGISAILAVAISASVRFLFP